MESNKEDKSDNALTAKGQNDAITMEEFDAFCSGQTEILMAGMDTSVPPESRQGTAAPTLENTYRLEPCKKFRPVQVQTVIEMAFHEHLEDKVYERRAAKQWDDVAVRRDQGESKTARPTSFQDCQFCQHWTEGPTGRAHWKSLSLEQGFRRLCLWHLH